METAMNYLPGECRHGKDDKFMLGFTFSRVETSRKGFQEHF